jgi:uncharacterized protein (TIGR02594 family)
MPLEQKIYVVRPGDTLTLIAAKSGVAYKVLLQANPQISNPNLIFAGQSLVLPSTADRSKLLTSMAADAYPGDEPLWLKLARREVGQVELEPGSNPRIVEYSATCTKLKRDLDDDTAWCSAFVNWCVTLSGIVGKDSLWALDWAKADVNLKKLARPEVGAVSVFERYEKKNGKWRLAGGHVAFHLADRGDHELLLGGNQSNSVCEKLWPKNSLAEDTPGRESRAYLFKHVGHYWPVKPGGG